jgi:PAS domain S-box-containing protein
VRADERETTPVQLRPSIPAHSSASDTASVWLQRGVETLGLAVACCAIVIAGHQLRYAGTDVSPLSPVCGFALAALYRRGNSAIGGIFLGGLSASVTEHYLASSGADPVGVRSLLQFVSLHPLNLALSAAKAMAYTVEAIIGSALIRTFTHGEVFDDVRGVVVLCLSALAASAVGSALVVGSRYAGLLIPEAQLNSAWLASWLRHFVGTLYLFPFVATWWRLLSLRTRPHRAMLQGILALLLLLLLTQIATKMIQVSIFVFPLLLLIVLRFEAAIAMTAIVIVSTVTIVATVNGHGLFARSDLNESVFLTQRVVFVVAFTVLLLNATIAERRRALAKSESALNRFQVLFKAAPNGVLAVDGSGLIIHANEQLEKAFGYGRSELIGCPVEILVPHMYRGAHTKLRQRYCLLPEKRPMGAGRELYGRRKDGSEFPLEIGLAPCSDKDGNLILASIVDITERKESERQHQILLRRMMQAVEMERLRLAHELHDETGQSVTAAMLELRQIEKESTEDGRNRVRRLRDQLENMGKSLHRIAWELRPASLNELGLKNALANYLAHWMVQSGIQVDFHCGEGKVDAISEEVSTIIYRVAQEALTNVAKHAVGASTATLIIDGDQNLIRLTIEDDGCGFDVSSVVERSDGGLGLAGMRERLSLVRGELEIESAPGHGTTLFIRIPREQDSAHEQQNPNRAGG